MSAASEKPFVLLLSQDLFFASRIEGAAEGAGLELATASGREEALAEAVRPGCRGLLVDLVLPGLSVADLMSGLPAAERVPVIAFGPHVAADRLEEARQAGCDTVMPRSRFSATLPEILQGLRDAN